MDNATITLCWPTLGIFFSLFHSFHFDIYLSDNLILIAKSHSHIIFLKYSPEVFKHIKKYFQCSYHCCSPVFRSNRWHIVSRKGVILNANYLHKYFVSKGYNPLQFGTSSQFYDTTFHGKIQRDSS